MLSRMKSLFAVPSSADLERDYLNESVSAYDLEHRQREIDRGLFRQRRRSF